MASAHEFKRQRQLPTPLLLFECRLRNGSVERWSTHAVAVDGEDYEARVLRHNLFELRLGSDEGIDTSARLSVTLANVDSRYSQIERVTGWKGAKLTVRFVFQDLRYNLTASEPIAVYLGVANPPEEISEKTIRLSFVNRLSLQRVTLPAARIQSRCPWVFPCTAEQRDEALGGGPAGVYSPFYQCGYSADREGGCGNLTGGQPFTSCGYTKADCEARGMYRKDDAGRETARFGGFQFLPPSVQVRSYGERGAHASEALDGRARANDVVPIIYGTGWYQPPVVFARNDGNLTHCEVLLGLGPIEAVHTVVVNGVEIPMGVTGSDMGATGWYNIVSPGTRNGGFNLNFADASGQPMGDPHGSMAVLAVAVPNRIHDGRGIPKVDVLIDGIKLERFDASGEPLEMVFTKNPAWLLLDVLRRSGWQKEELNLKSFADAAGYCDELISARDAHGNALETPRFECNLVLAQRRSAAEVVRGIRTASALMLTFDAHGRLHIAPETSLARQHPVKSEGSNSTEELAGGWPASEFGDGTDGSSGILRRANGEPAIRLWSRSTSECSNRLSVEFQNAFNEYQQDSVSVVDLDDVLSTGQELSAALPALGLPHFDQAARVTRFHLLKGLLGNQYVEFETSVQALGLRPGDLVALTYQKEGLDRAPFRILKLAPGENYETVRITAQYHDDRWYDLLNDGSGLDSDRQRRTGRHGSTPRPITGRRLNDAGEQEFDVTEDVVEESDGKSSLHLRVGFTPPKVPTASAAGIPIVGLSPKIESSGGIIKGGQTYYYALSAVDGSGAESDLSFVVRATIPTGSNTNRVVLRQISVAPGTASLRVYRGQTPSQLLLIAADVAISSKFIDPGYAAQLAPPPDPNYDHANFHWRMELLPETPATIAGDDTIGNSVLAMLINEYRGSVVRITAGKGSGQERVVLANDATTITVATRWIVVPDATSQFTVAEASWRFGGATRSDEVQFEVPNRTDTFVQISGRAANALDVETPSEISPLHRHLIGGGEGSGGDADVPPKPAFGLSANGRGQLELVGIGFEDLQNTRTVTAGTLIIHFWNELIGATPYELAATLTAGEEWLVLNQPGPASDNDFVQIGGELLRVLEVAGGGSLYRVERGAHGSAEQSHSAGALAWHLKRHVTVASFPRNFFGTPASGSYLLSIPLRDARVCAAEFFVTNTRGDSPTRRASYAGLAEGGLRTLSGGQYTIQVTGEPALEEGAAPPLIVEETHSVGDIFATLAEAPVLGSLTLRLRVNGEPYCDMVIAAGSRTSPAISGSTLPPLHDGDELTLDIIDVPQAPGSRPGRNLTVTVRL